MKLFITLCLSILLSTNLAYAKSDTQDIDKVVAVVNNGIITQSELNKEYHNARLQLQHTQTKMPDNKVLKQQVLQHLIDRQLQLELANKMKIKVPKARVELALQNIADRNHIPKSQLRDAVAAQGLDYEEYLKNIREGIYLSQLRQTVLGKDIHISKNDIDAYLQKLQQKTQNEYRVKNILIPLSDTPSSDEVQKAKTLAEKLLVEINKGADFDHLATEYAGGPTALEGGDLGWRKLAEIPDVFMGSVSHMKKNDIKGPVRAANGFHIIKLVDIRNKSTKHMASLTHVRHILIKTNAITTHDKAKASLLKLRQRLMHGEDFATLAKQYSNDMHSKIKGGDLGWVHLKEVTPEFRLAMTTLKIHELSQPVKSGYGWHLIEVLARKEVDDNKEQLRNQAHQVLYRQKFEAAAVDWLKKLRSEAYIKIVGEKNA